MGIVAPNIALLAASCRTESLNRRLVSAVEKQMRSKGAVTNVIDLAEYSMPLFCGDQEIPEAATLLVAKLKEFDAVFIATPELNGSPPAILKNLIDWTSMLGLEHFENPIYCIGSATPGPLSGVMAMEHLANILARLGASVVPTYLGTGNAKAAFDESGNLTLSPSRELATVMVDQVLTRVMEKKCVIRELEGIEEVSCVK